MRGGGSRRRCWWCGVLVLLSACMVTPTPSPSSPATLPVDHATPATTITAALSSPTLKRPALSVPVATGNASVVGTPSGTSPFPSITYDRPTSLGGFPGPVTVVAWSPDGTRLATSSGGSFDTPDYAIQLWNANGVLLAVLEGHTAAINSLAWSPDGRVLASGAQDTTVRLWRGPDMASSVLGEVQPSGRVSSLAWSPDGAMLAVGTIGNAGGLAGMVRLFRADGSPIATLHTRLAGNSLLMTGGKFLNLAWSRDGRLLAAGAVDYAIWQPDGTLVGTIYLGGTPAWGMAWAPDGQVLAIGDENGTVALFDSAGKGVAIWHNAGPVGGLGSLAFSPDGLYLAVGATTNARLLRVADPSADPLVLQTGTGANVAWSPDGATLAVATLSTASKGVAVRLWRSDGVEAAVFGGCAGKVQVIAWSPDGTALVAGTTDKHACLWKVK